MINPMNFMHIKPMLEQFRDRHPKFLQFFGYVGEHVQEGSLLEISVTDTNGKKIVTNIRIAPEDLELFQHLRNTLH